MEKRGRGRPRGPEKIQTGVYIRKDLWKGVVAEAKERGVKLTQVVEERLERGKP